MFLWKAIWWFGQSTESIKHIVGRLFATCVITSCTLALLFIMNTLRKLYNTYFYCFSLSYFYVLVVLSKSRLMGEKISGDNVDNKAKMSKSRLEKTRVLLNPWNNMKCLFRYFLLDCLQNYLVMIAETTTDIKNNIISISASAKHFVFDLQMLKHSFSVLIRIIVLILLIPIFLCFVIQLLLSPVIGLLVSFPLSALIGFMILLWEKEFRLRWYLCFLLISLLSFSMVWLLLLAEILVIRLIFAFAFVILFSKNLLPYFTFVFTVLLYLWNCHSDLSAKYLKLRSLTFEICQEVHQENQADEIELRGVTDQSEQPNEQPQSKSQIIYPDENDVPRIPKKLCDSIYQEILPESKTVGLSVLSFTCKFSFFLFTFLSIMAFGTAKDQEATTSALTLSVGTLFSGIGLRFVLNVLTKDESTQSLEDVKMKTHIRKIIYNFQRTKAQDNCQDVNWCERIKISCQKMKTNIKMTNKWRGCAPAIIFSDPVREFFMEIDTQRGKFRWTLIPVFANLNTLIDIRLKWRKVHKSDKVYQKVQFELPYTT